MIKNICGKCLWFHRITNDYKRGLCRRFPETVSKNQTEFCGEFTVKTPAKAKKTAVKPKSNMKPKK